MKIYDYNGKKNICGDRLREARVVRRLRQEDLAAQIQLKGINMERDSISRIEIGTRFVSDFELKIFAEVLGVSEAYLSRPDVEDPSYGLDEAPYLNAVRMRHGQKGASELEDLLDGVKTYIFSQNLLTYTH